MALSERERRELARARAKQTGTELFETGGKGTSEPLRFGGAEERRAAELEAIRTGEIQKIEEEKVIAEVRGPGIAETETLKRGSQEDILAREEAKRTGEVGLETKEETGSKSIIDFPDTLGEFSQRLLDPFEGQNVTAGTLPLGGSGILFGGKAALNTAKVATSIKVPQVIKKVLDFFKTDFGKKLGKYGSIGYIAVTERSLASIDTALSQVRESLTLPVQMAAVNPNDVTKAFDLITSYDEDINEYESMLKRREPFALSVKLTGRTRPIYQRIKKLRDAVDLARGQIAKIEAEGRILTDEEQTLIISDMNKVLDSMENPKNFLGF